MRMIEMRARRRAMVLEDDDVAETAVPLQVVYALAAGPQHLLDVALRHRRQRLLMPGRLDDHLVRADAIHLVEQTFALAVERAFHAQHGELVRHDAQAPA